MSENMEKFRHMDGSEAVLEGEHYRIVLQHGSPEEGGINGCRIEDIIEALQEKLLDFQGRDLSCEENATALYHLDLAREALLLRRRRREAQGVLGTRDKHRSQTLEVSRN
ncbi:MAG: hypothetical protein KDC26_11015 [Armatimonadetes bacterium]|nr:hypothetical protein [Armatimonadota bacterium]